MWRYAYVNVQKVAGFPPECADARLYGLRSIILSLLLPLGLGFLVDIPRSLLYDEAVDIPLLPRLVASFRL